MNKFTAFMLLTIIAAVALCLGVISSSVFGKTFQQCAYYVSDYQVLVKDDFRRDDDSCYWVADELLKTGQWNFGGYYRDYNTNLDTWTFFKYGNGTK